MSRARWWTGCALALVLAAATAAYASHASDREKKARSTAQQNEAVSAQQAKVAELTRALESQRDAIRKVQAEAASATNETDRAAAQAKLAAAQLARQRTEATLAALQGMPAPAGASTPPRIGCSCDAGDPDCSML